MDFWLYYDTYNKGFLGFNMATVGVPAYSSSLGFENALTGLVTTFAAFAALSIRPIAGYLLSRTSSKTVSFIGFMLMALPTLLLSPLKDFISLLIIRLIQGLGWGLASTACSSIITQATPFSRLSEGIGFSGAVSSVTTAVAPVIAILLVERISGVAMIMFIGLVFLFSGLFVSRLRTTRVSDQNSNDRNEDRRFLEIGAVFPAALMFCIAICYSPIITFITPATKANGLSSATLFFVLYAIATVTIRPLTGLFVDRYGCTIPTFLSLFTATLSALLMSIAHTTSTLCLAGFFSGLSTGIGMNSLQTMALKKVSRNKKGLAMSTFLFGFDLGMALGAVTAGIMIKKVGYNFMFVPFSLFPLVGIIMLLFSFIVKKRKDVTPK